MLGTKCKRAGRDCRQSDDGLETCGEVMRNTSEITCNHNRGTLLQICTEAGAERGQRKRKFKGSLSLRYSELQASMVHSKTYVAVRL